MAENNATEGNAATAGPAKKSLARKLVPIGFVITVVAVECVVAYSYLPAVTHPDAVAHAAAPEAAAPKPAAEEKHGHAAEKEAEKEKEKGKEKEKAGEKEERNYSKTDLVEVDLGQFTVTSVLPGSTTTLRIAFHLYGTVSGLDQDRFNARLKEAQHRLREQVILAIRGAEMSDLTEPGLGLLKRTILEKTNTTLGEHLLKAIVVSEFSFMEV